MDRNQDRHLNEDLLAIAVIDKTDLPASFRKHLDTCPQCRDSLQAFEQDLRRIGQLAEAFTPQLSRPVRLPVAEKYGIPGRLYDRRGWIGAAVAALLIISLIWWTGDVGIHPESGVPHPGTELWEDQHFMMEISMLSENALPQTFVDIYETAESDLDEEFYEFIIPLPDNNDSLSFDQGMKGDLRC